MPSPVTFLCIVVACAAVAAGQGALPALNVDPNAISVSGLSAGAFMAVQYSVAFSAQVMGAGVIAGGPFYCASGSLITAQENCMLMPEMIDLSKIYNTVSNYERAKSIDPSSNIGRQNIYIYSGRSDTVVKSGVVKTVETFYKHYAASNATIVTEYDLDSEHGFPTTDYGSACSHLGTPFILKCNYDAAGQILNTIYGNLSAPASAPVTGNLKQYSQTLYTTADAHMADYGFVYVPTACQSNSTKCRLHVAFHGCEQTTSDIGSTYPEHTGYNTWAESNNIVVLYPQCAKDMLKENPNGCFDWWGYSGRDYANQNGPQMAAVRKMVGRIAGI